MYFGGLKIEVAIDGPWMVGELVRGRVGPMACEGGDNSMFAHSAWFGSREGKE